MLRTLRVCVALVCMSVPQAVEAAACNGSSSCSVCTSCSGCGYCKSGGTCGVCRNRSTPPRATTPVSTIAPPPAPRPVATPPSAPVVVEVERQPEPSVRVVFSTEGKLIDSILAEIRDAERSIVVMAHRVTSPRIVTALAAASGKGIAVQVLLDGTADGDTFTEATFLQRRGVNVLLDDTHVTQRAQFVLIDGSTLLTGSCAFSDVAADNSVEQLLIVKNQPDLALRFSKVYVDHLQHARAYEMTFDPGSKADGIDAMTALDTRLNAKACCDPAEGEQK